MLPTLIRVKLLSFQILKPLDISMNTSAPTGEGMHGEILVSDVELNVSATIIRTITAILSGLSEKKVSE